jgi:hypothetical protein
MLYCVCLQVTSAVAYLHEQLAKRAQQSDQHAAVGSTGTTVSTAVGTTVTNSSCVTGYLALTAAHIMLDESLVSILCLAGLCYVSLVD